MFGDWYIAPMFALSSKLSRQGAAGPIRSAVNGNVEIDLSILNHDFCGPGGAYLNLAAFVLAATRTVQIGEPDGNFAHMVVRPIERETKTTFDMLTQVIGKIKASCLNKYFHRSMPFQIIDNS